MVKRRRPDRWDTLTTARKILHVQDLWDEIAARPDDVELTAAQRRELRRRMRRHASSPDATVPWHVVRQRVRKKP